MKKVDLMNSLNTSNLVSDGITDLFSKSVKDRSGVESTMKMLEKFKDKININELLVKSAIHKNTELIKYVVETYQLNVDNEIMINPTILLKTEENNKSIAKDNLALVNTPLVILSAISGNIELLEYLISNKVDLKQTGHICISPKKKNSVVSNILGAAAYYGHLDYISYVLELKQVRESNNYYNNNLDQSKTLKSKSYTNELSVNFKSLEKKLKTTKTSQFTREMTGLTPVMLASLNEENHDQAFSIYMKLKSISIIDEVDFEGNNILHLATRASNEKLVRELITEENFNFKDQNSTGETPYIIANSLNNISICNFLASLEKSEEYIENNIYSLMEEDNKNQQKGKKKKKKNKEESVGIGVSNFIEKNPLNPKKAEVVVPSVNVEKKEYDTENEIDKAFDPNAMSDDDYYDEKEVKKITGTNATANSNTISSSNYDKNYNYNSYEENLRYPSNNNSNNYYAKYEQQDNNYYLNNNDNNYDYYNNSYNYQKGQKQGYGNYNYNYNTKGYNNYSNQFNQPKTTTYQSKGSFNKGKYYNNYNSNNTYSKGGKDYYQTPNSQRNNSQNLSSSQQVYVKVVNKDPELQADNNKSEVDAQEKNKNTKNDCEDFNNETEENTVSVSQINNNTLTQTQTINCNLNEEQRNSEDAEKVSVNLNKKNSERNNSKNERNYDNEEIDNLKNNENSINKLIVDDAMNNIKIVNEQDFATNTSYLESLIVSF
jgi:hypothetical protein